MGEASKEITLNTPGIVMAISFEILFPIILSIIWTLKFKGKFIHISTGLAGFFISVTILESLFLYIIRLLNIKILYYIIGGMSPGIFEETARYICLLLIFKNDKQKKISVSYGIGHGGLESMLIGVNLLTTLILKDELIRRGTLKNSIGFYEYLMSALERFFAVIYHIASSVLVFKAVSEKKIILYIVAIIIHDLVDIFPLLYQLGVIDSLIIIELIFAVSSSCFAFFAYKLYINIKEYNDELEQNIAGDNMGETIEPSNSFS